MRRRGFGALAVGFLFVVLLGPASPAWAKALVVTNDNDRGEGSLREAVAAANDEEKNPGLDRITFAPSLTRDANAKITLDSAGDKNFGPSALGVTSRIEIEGPEGKNGVVIDRSSVPGAPKMRLFYVHDSSGARGELTLRNLTLKDGLARGGDGGKGPGGGPPG